MAFSARRSPIKKAPATVVSAFYQHFDDYVRDGRLFHGPNSSLFICLTISYKLMQDCFYFLFGILARAGC